MRLTLRTLLAYMDDILEPADHEDLGQKIEASDFATELIHRSRDTVRRLRLGAPPVLASGSDDVLDSVNLGDANSVAEYLDNTLPPESVAEFERMCLEQGIEPDMHLAEVASCHHVLTMVLGEPAEVDASLKARMYKLPSQVANSQQLRIEPSHTPPPVAAPPQATTPQPSIAAQPSAPAAVPQAQSALKDSNELPDYLREAAAAQRRSRRWAIGTTLVALAGIIAWFVNAPVAEPPAELAQSEIEAFDDGEIDIEGLDDFSGDMPSDVPGANDVPGASEDAAGELQPFEPGDAEATEAAPADPSVPATETETAPEFPVTPDVDLPPGEPSPPVDADRDAPVSETEAQLPAGSVPPAPVLPEYPNTDTPEVGLPEVETEAEDEGEGPERVASLPEPPVAEPPRVDSPAEDDTESETADEVAAAESTGPQRLGNYPGNNDVLLIFNPDPEQWVRLAPRTPLSAGDRLLTLPKFRTHVVLADLNAYLCGATQLQIPLENFDTLATDTELHLEMIYGRLLLNAGLNGSQVAMRIEDQQREFRLPGSVSLAVDVDRMFVPGSDYEHQAAPTKATWYLTSGSLEWPTPAGGTQTITGPAMWTTVDGIDGIPEPVDELPEWIDSEPVTNVEFRARNNLAEELAPGEPVGIRLLELTEGEGLGRQKEVRILAAASSNYVGEFEPLVKALNDSDQSRAWDEHIHDLRQALALSPRVAQQVREALVNLRGEAAAADLMNMLLGYDSQQIGTSREAIQTGALLQLIQWLDHESLDYRVLAIHNIEEITGKNKGYRPDDTLKRRKISLRKIWDEFESHELLREQ